jgi:two-component system nitrogen regulation sensor histidine kinase GlnL
MNGYTVQSETDMAWLLDSMGTAVLVFDARLRLTYLNQAGEVLLAHSARHVCGRPVHELVANAEMLAGQLEETLGSEQVMTHRGCLLELPDAPDLRVNCNFTPVTDAHGEDCVLVELRKVDYHLRIEQEEHLITQQQATHELVRGLAHVMDSMLGPNKLPNIQAVNIHEVLERVSALVVAEAGEKLRFHQDYDPSLPDIQADADLLVQAVLNIVRNAAQALGNSGDITLRTRIQRNFNIGASRHRLVARIQIIDNGPGIDEALRKQIFYPMITGRSDGTGLGLSIAQALISRHQGLVECTSKPGETIFTILLPLEGKHES